MRLAELLKPNIFKIITFIFIGIVFLYFAKESTCGVSFFFAFCYKAYGFPFFYMIDGDVGAASDYANTLFLGRHFSKSGSILLNPAAFALNVILMYLLACFITVLFKDKIRHRMQKLKNKINLKT